MKIRNLMIAIFRPGTRYEFLPRVEEAKPMKIRPAEREAAEHSCRLEVGQFQQLFAALN